jgi:hypothetical protein
VVRWRDGEGRVAHQQEVRDLLPIALAVGARATQPVDVVAPPSAGDYLVELALASQPERVLSRAAVRVPALPTVAPEPQTSSP